MKADSTRPAVDPVRMLLVEMLACVRHTRDTPLEFGIDAAGIVAVALERAAKRLAPNAPPIERSRDLVSAIDRVAKRALDPSAVETRTRDGAEREPTANSLEAWLDETHRHLSAVHPLALDILGGRVEGETSREIAERLELGLRLSLRITREIRAAQATGVRA